MRALAFIFLAACGAGAAGVDAGGGTGGGDGGAGEPVDAGENEIVRAHNAVRARAMPEPMPALPPMSWHEGAAAVAAAYAEQCRFVHNPNLGNAYGENLYAAYGDSPTATEVVESWASEVRNYDLANNTCAGVCGHYTQIVWRTSVGVGCASKVCDTNSPFGANRSPWVLWVCDYAPPGNQVGRRPY
ncbi:MAG: hypothetical protein JNK82_21500 [Myxococcaceae bacterium]|nr:hypothetical protein [Myxococcaceae bacterium]